MEAKEYIREQTRMFDSLRDAERRGAKGCDWVLCDECPLYDESRKCLDNTEEAVDIVERWSKEHPVKTIKDDFLEKHPNAVMNSNGTPNCCADFLGYEVKCDAGCRDCWNTPLEEVE